MTVLRYQNPLAFPFNLLASECEQAAHTAKAAWHPAAEVAEEAEQYVLRLDVPGVPREAIELTVENRVLTIRGERLNAAKEGSRVVSNERESGKFERHFKLPQNAEVESIAASATDGVLAISIAKQASAAARTIEVG